MLGSAFGLVLAAAAGALWLRGADTPAGPAPPTAGELRFGGPFTLVEHSGRTVSERDYLGRHLLVFFGFTSCPAVCPTTLQTVSLLLADLGPLADKLQPLFITVDPAQDTVQVLAGYVAHFDKRIVGLTGTPGQIAAVARAYHVVYRKVKGKDGSEELDHTAALFLMGPDGRHVAHIPPEASPRRMAELIRGHITGRPAGNDEKKEQK